MSTSTHLYPTTGEPMDVVARRNRVGLLFLIAMDVSGTLALLVSYSYLWSLNVNGGWAPNNIVVDDQGLPKSRTALPWAADWPFWAIFAAVLVSTLLFWFGFVGLKNGNKGRFVASGIVSMLIVIAAFIGQIIQMKSFPFGPDNGGYASATWLLCLANVFHLGILLFLLLALINRTRRGLITTDNRWQARLIGYWVIWLTIACLIGVICTTFMKDSSNTNPPVFGTFQGE